MQIVKQYVSYKYSKGLIKIVDNKMNFNFFLLINIMNLVSAKDNGVDLKYRSIIY